MSFQTLKKRHFLLSGVFFLVACELAPVRDVKRLSSIDAQFQLQQEQKQKVKTESVQSYRLVVAPSLSTHCKWYPSDSRYAEIAQRKCGRLKGGMMAFSRFLYEEDASRMGYDFVINNDHLEFVDYPNECWF